jgi:hypothetical protein
MGLWGGFLDFKRFNTGVAENGREKAEKDKSDYRRDAECAEKSERDPSLRSG